MAIVEYLDWDSTFYGIKIGKIIYTNLSENEFGKYIENARKENYKLLYIFCDEQFYFSNITMENNDIKLVDRKIVYMQKLKGINQNSTKNVQEYNSSEICNELKKLAYMSGEYSRFKTDKHFSKQNFEKLYETWMVKSINKEIADNVYVTHSEMGLICGMATLKYKNSHSEIGLIAVNTEERKKGYGKKLLQICFDNSFKNNIEKIKITTQFENKIACKFYERNGFEKESITNIYHLWL